MLCGSSPTSDRIRSTAVFIASVSYSPSTSVVTMTVILYVDIIGCSPCISLLLSDLC